MADPDPYDLARFVHAQDADYDVALAEIRSGRKRSHWMWYVFPQIAGLGFSPTSQHFAIRGLAEARSFLAHPILGPRLQECTDALLALNGRSAHDILGSPDDLKLRSSATLFAQASPAGSAFHRIIDKYFEGRPDERTLAAL